MLKQRAVAATFLLFASIGAAFVSVVSSGLWEDKQSALLAAGAVAAAGLAAGLLGRRLFFFMKDIANGPVLLARHADAAAACIAVTLLIVFMIPVMGHIDGKVALAALFGVDFLTLVYAGVCLGVAVEYVKDKIHWVAAAFLAGLAAGFGIGAGHLPEVMLGCATCGAAASLLFGAGHRRIGEEGGGWKQSAIRAAFVAVICVIGIGVLMMAQPAVERAAHVGKGITNTATPKAGQLVLYMKSLYEYIAQPLKTFLMALAVISLAYAAAMTFVKDSKKFMARHNAVKHSLVSLFALAAMGALLLFSLLSPNLSKQYDVLEKYKAPQIRSGGGK